MRHLIRSRWSGLASIGRAFAPGLFLVAIAAALAPTARAGLIGAGYTLTLDYPAIGTTYDGPFTGTVGAGVEVASVFGTSHDIGDQTILITEMPAVSNYASVAFSGYHYTFTGAPAITGVSLDASSTAAVPIITFDADEVFVNFAGESVGPGQFSLLDLTFAAPTGPGGAAVPLPAAIWPGLLMGGVTLTGLRLRRRPA